MNFKPRYLNLSKALPLTWRREAGASTRIRRLHVSLTKPDDIVPHLAKQEADWRAGYSAQELAVLWAGAKNTFPPSVRAVLDTAAEYVGTVLVDGFFEREVDLGTPGRNSQTDLMVVAGLENELAIIAVEGKVEESFASLVSEWTILLASSGDWCGCVKPCNLSRLRSASFAISFFIEPHQQSMKHSAIVAGTLSCSCIPSAGSTVDSRTSQRLLRR